MINNVLIFLLLFFLPTQLGKHFFLPFSYLSGVRIDYLAPTLYLTDLIIFLLLVLNIKDIFQALKNKRLLFFLIIFIIPIFFSLSRPIAICRYLKILEFIFIFIIIKRQKIPGRQILMAFLAGSLIQTILVLSQFINKHSIQGIFYWLGERYINLSISGIAKTTLAGIELLRPYGSFSHPNSMSGFYLLVYFFVLTNKKFNRLLIFKYLLLFTCLFLVFLSFSKTAILVLIILNSSYFLFTSFKHCRICTLSRAVVIVALAIIFLSGQSDPMSGEKRLVFVQNALNIIIQNPMFGVGWGNYLVAQNKFPLPFSYFFQQPVHNIFLLFISEAGIIISLLTGWQLKNIIKNNLKNITFIFMLLVIVATGMFDHYWITLQQNYLLVAVLFAL